MGSWSGNATVVGSDSWDFMSGIGRWELVFTKSGWWKPEHVSYCTLPSVPAKVTRMKFIFCNRYKPNIPRKAGQAMDPETHRERILLSLCIRSYLKPTTFQELPVCGVQLYNHLEFQFLLKLAWLEFLLLATQSSDWDLFHYPKASLVPAYSAFSHVHFLQMAISQNVCEALMTRRLIAELFIMVKTLEKKLRWSTARDHRTTSGSEVS